MGAVWSSVMLSAPGAPPPLRTIIRHAMYTLADGPPSPQVAAELEASLRALGPAELAVPVPADAALPPCPLEEARSPPRRPRVGYMHLCESAACTVGVFLLPRCARLPLHDHPGMCVLSKPLYGAFHAANHDLLGDPRAAQDHGGWARAARTGVIDDPQDVQNLSPVRANVHEIHALTDCAFLDVIFPPYAAPGRRCQYYEARPAPSAGAQAGGREEAPPEAGAVWLQPVPEPVDLVVRSVPNEALDEAVDAHLRSLEAELGPPPGAAPAGA